MTWDELSKKIDNFKTVKIQTNFGPKEQEEYAKIGITPEMMYRKCVEVYLKEYLYAKFGLNHIYTFEKAPIEAIVLGRFYTELNKIIEEDIYPYYEGDLDKIVEYLNSKTL